MSSAAATEEEGAAAAQAASCVAILMQHPTNAHAMNRGGGLRQLAELIFDSEHSGVRALFSLFYLATRWKLRLVGPIADEVAANIAAFPHRLSKRPRRGHGVDLTSTFAPGLFPRSERISPRAI